MLELEFVLEFLVWIRAAGIRGASPPVAGLQHGGRDRAGAAGVRLDQQEFLFHTHAAHVHPPSMPAESGECVNGNVDVIQKRIIRKMGYYAAGNRMHGAPPTGYLPIEEHGIVGDLRTVALVGTDGTVDWYCPSRFDAPALFGALLDARKGGYFSLSSHVTTAPEADVPAGHQHPAHPVPRRRGGRRGHRLHGPGDQQHPEGP